MGSDTAWRSGSEAWKPRALVLLPLESWWLLGRAEFTEEAGCGHTVRSQGDGGCGWAVGS